MARINQIDWIEAFVTLAETASFTRAARSLHLAQSRISARVSSLETALGQKLVDRSRRPVTLTEAGEAFLPHARSLLTALTRACDDVDALAGDVRGHVVVGTHPSISAGFMPRVLHTFATRYPRVTIDLTERTSALLVQSLAEGSVDLAVRAQWEDATHPTLRSIPLWGEPYAFVVPSSHPLAQGDEPVDPVQLFSEPIIGISPPGGALEPELLRLAHRWKTSQPVLSWRTEQPQTLVNLVREGLGVGVINQLAFLTSEHDGVVELLVVGDPEARVVALWWDSNRHMSSAIDAFARFIRSFPIPEGTYPVEGTLAVSQSRAT